MVRNGAVKLTRSLNQLKIPPTVQAILAARIDRLPADEKDLLQTLAVIGREFPLVLVRRLIPTSDDELNRMLSALQLGEFIYEQPAFPEVEYIFKHALTQEVAYGSLLAARRRALHERIGGAIESLHADHLEDHYEELAHHYSRSNDARKAAEYLLHAGGKAGARFGGDEVLDYYARAIATLKQLPQDDSALRLELNAQMGLASTLRYLKGLGSVRVEPALLRAAELAERLEDPANLLLAKGRMNVFYINRLELVKKRENTQQVLALAKLQNDPSALAYPIFALGTIHLMQGNLHSAREHLEQALALAGPEAPGTGPLVGGTHANSLVFLGLAFWYMGHPGQALALCERALSEVRRRNNAFATAPIMDRLVSVHVFRGEPEAVGRLAHELSEIAVQHGFPLDSAYAEGFEGWALVAVGQTADGIKRLRQGVKAGDATGSRLAGYYLRAQLAESLLASGWAAEAGEVVSRQLELIAETGARRDEAEFTRLRGEVKLALERSAVAAAEADFRRAIEIARGQGAKSWELRAVMSLARSLHDRTA